MSKSAAKYLLVSLPTSISLANEHDEALTALRNAVSTDNGTTYPFHVPIFKIGTLDALVQQADDLAKLSADCEAVVGKVGDSLASILEGDQDKIAQQKNVNDSMSRLFKKIHGSYIDPLYLEPVDQYVQTFSWNKVKYRADKPIAELITGLRKVYFVRYPKKNAWSLQLHGRNSLVSTTMLKQSSHSTTTPRTTSRKLNGNKRKMEQPQPPSFPRSTLTPSFTNSAATSPPAPSSQS